MNKTPSCNKIKLKKIDYSENFNTSNLISNSSGITQNFSPKVSLAKKTNLNFVIKLPKIIKKNNSTIDKNTIITELKSKPNFKLPRKIKFKQVTPNFRKNNRINQKTYNEILINNIYKKSDLDIDKKIPKPKLSEKELQNFILKDYQTELMQRMIGSFNYRTVLDLKNNFAKLNKKLNDKHIYLINRWISLALKEEGVLPHHLLKRFCEVGRLKGVSELLW